MQIVQPSRFNKVLANSLSYFFYPFFVGRHSSRTYVNYIEEDRYFHKRTKVFPVYRKLFKELDMGGNRNWTSCSILFSVVYFICRIISVSGFCKGMVLGLKWCTEKILDFVGTNRTLANEKEKKYLCNTSFSRSSTMLPFQAFIKTKNNKRFFFYLPFNSSWALEDMITHRQQWTKTLLYKRRRCQ